VCTGGGTEVPVGTEVEPHRSGSIPPPTARGQNRRLLLELEAKHASVKTVGFVLSARRKRELHMIEPDDSHPQMVARTWASGARLIDRRAGGTAARVQEVGTIASEPNAWGTAVVTGASSGIGEATARELAAAGFDLVVGARRLDRVQALAAELPRARAIALDVADPASVDSFCTEVPECRVLVNNAGGALGLQPIASADEDDWRQMWETNVMGTLRMTRSLLDKLVGSGDGLVINIGSVAAFERYPGGAGYHAAKSAQRAITDVLRMELLGRPVRVSEVDPGMVETDFSLVRFGGDAERANAVYAGVEALCAKDIAECITFIATRPSHVDIDEMVVRPRDQARVHMVNRRAPNA
jgi:NADP-dependent 3-hydroxy acid dehydrogenase YdfG